MPQKILLVEDEAIIAMSEAKMLQKHGYEVVTAYNGSKAIEAAKSDPAISLILMDIDLGAGMDGTEVARRILHAHDIPIVFLSSHAGEAYVDMVKEITGYGYVLKNSGEFILLESINMALKLFEAHQKLKRNQQLLQDTGRLARVGGWEFDIATMKQRWTEETYRIHELDPTVEPDVDMGLNFFIPEHKPFIEAAVQRVIDHGEPYDLELQIVTAKGNPRWVHTKGKAYYHHNTIYKIGGSIQDITELKETKFELDTYRKEVEKERDKFYTLTETSPIPIVYVAASGAISYANQEAERSLGLTKAEASSRPYNDPQWRTTDFEGNPFPEDQLPFSLVKSSLKPVYDIQHAISPADGNTMFLSINATPLFDQQGAFDGMIAALKDITHEKTAEKQLRATKEHLRTTLRSIGDAVISTDIDGMITMMNPVAESLTSWSVEAAKGNSLDEVFHIIHAATRETVDNPVEKVLQKGEIVGLANHTVLISGAGHEYQIADSAAPIKDDDGNITGVVLVFRDVTDEYEREQQLRESEEKYKTLFNNSPVNITVHDKDTGEVVDANEVAFTSYGYSSLSEFQENEFWTDPPYSFTEALEWIQKAYNEGNQKFEWKNQKITGEIFWEYVTLRPITINGIDRVFATAIDITEKKKAEEELQSSKERYKAIFYNSEISLWEENIAKAREKISALKQKGIADFKHYFDTHPEAVWEIAREIKVVDINNATLSLYRASSKEAMLGSLDKTLYLTEDTFTILRDECVAIAEGITSVRGEMKTKALDGTVYDIMMNVYISYDKDIMIVAISDISPYKNAIAEKDFLMRELNHRVKNNLNLVSSLVSLKDAEIEEDLTDVKYRLDAVRLVHEKLYQHNTIEHIEVEDYFQELLESLFTSLTNQSIHIVTHIENVSIHTKRALPLGLIVNEIAINAIKYGFIPNQASYFYIDMSKNEATEEYVLTLSNTGTPFPEEVDFENSGTFGLTLVRNLVSQLHGTIELQKAPYPSFTIRFPTAEV